MIDFLQQNSDIILIIVTIIISLMVIKMVTKILFKLIIITILIITAFIGYQFFSGTNIIDNVTKLYCNSDKEELIKCECFVKPIISDLEKRFSKEELDKLKTRKLKTNTEFIKSYKIKESEIRECFEKTGESNNIIEEIIKDVKNGSLNPFN